MVNDTVLVCLLRMLSNAVDPDLTARHILFARDILYLDWNHHYIYTDL